jgi:sec-independent protein translocase protein TatA
MVPQIGPLELLVVLIIALIVLGPKRLPEMGNSLGKGLRGFKDALDGNDDDDDAEDEPESPELQRSEPAPAAVADEEPATVPAAEPESKPEKASTASPPA